MRKEKKKYISAIAKQAAKMKVNKNLDTSGIENAPFFKKKMDKANEMLAIAGLPK